MLSYTRYPDLDFTWFVSEGETTIENWIDTVHTYGKEGMTLLELYDLTRQTNLFAVEEIGKILELTLETQSLRPLNGKTAVLVDEVVKFGLSRMYEMQADAEGVSSNTQVFYHLEAAASWLGDDVAQLVAQSKPAKTS